MKKSILENENLSEEIQGISAILESLGISISKVDDDFEREQKALNLVSHKLNEIAEDIDKIIEHSVSLMYENDKLKKQLSENKGD